ncbi:Adf1p [Kluyveromyces lactis]|uniref:KLLA0C00528p n=1 Tax=Kluyveromyces lactis (strain ATCC 8585 / CBS 2359 / DSM 70799 / NBRC 1267 / NRRL Y-1140 / WM37) TaxID=284590 RepID=Q6CV22_KLULA|nr:uncharacterized protein KLLA0_C00528g [Kluyveromyces lactis]CAH01068.1 KLLA0C00528p [Kluyveromyces lactis]|eukprot:XP_452217.1 uncharacterized protein KLLA0_C00528g [Kluyveromyces lactis]
MAKKQDNARSRKNGNSSFNHSDNKISKKHSMKNNMKSNKKKNQMQVRQLDKLDLSIADIVPNKAQKKPRSSASLEGQKVREHYKEDKEVVKKHDKEKKATEKKIEDQLELISGFSL